MVVVVVVSVAVVVSVLVVVVLIVVVVVFIVVVFVFVVVVVAVVVGARLRLRRQAYVDSGRGARSTLQNTILSEQSFLNFVIEICPFFPQLFHFFIKNVVNS